MLSKSSNEETIDLAGKKAEEYCQGSFNCAIGSLAGLQETFDLGGGPDIVKGAIYLPGLASRWETCGAVMGGLIALGLMFGRDKIYDPGYYTPEGMEYYVNVKWGAWTFVEEFINEFGSTRCGDIRPKIMGREYNTMFVDDLEQFLADGGQEKCCVVPKWAARKAAEIILATQQGRVFKKERRDKGW